MNKIKNLVFEGGGIAGVAFSGALLQMEKDNLLKDFVRVGGTSAGAITATLLAVGYTAEEISVIISGTKFSSFQDDNFGVIRDSYRLIKNYGWYQGDAFKKWLSYYIMLKTNKPEITFSDLHYGYKYKSLYVMGTNLTKQRSEIYSESTTPNMPIVDAIRISMSIPLFFQCERNVEGDILIDGGITDNYPIKLFDKCRYYALNEDENVFWDKDIYNPETIGFRVDTFTEINANDESWRNPSVNISNFKDYVKAIMTYTMEAANKRHLTTRDKDRTIFIDRDNIKAIDFNLTEEQIKLLIHNGKSAVTSFFKSREVCNDI